VKLGVVPGQGEEENEVGPAEAVSFISGHRREQFENPEQLKLVGRILLLCFPGLSKFR